MEFTVGVKAITLIALDRGITIHQYDWIVRATSRQTYLQNTQTLVALCQELGYIVNIGKLKLGPKKVFDFVGYQFDLREGKVRSTLEDFKVKDPETPLQTGTDRICPLNGTVNSYRKKVHLGQLHMRPIQWHFKNNWTLQESLEKVIPIPR